MIKTTKKLDQFMDWNLLNKNNYQRVLRVLGELDQDGDMASDDEEERDK